MLATLELTSHQHCVAMTFSDTPFVTWECAQGSVQLCNSLHPEVRCASQELICGPHSSLDIVPEIAPNKVKIWLNSKMSLKNLVKNGLKPYNVCPA